MPAPQSPHDQPGLPILIVRFGHVDEVLRPGEGPVFIGRELPAQLRLDDPRISRTHARIESAGTRWVAVDEASTNGMFLDGEKVSTVSLTDGMTLHLGHADGIAVRFSFIDPEAGTVLATHAMPSRAYGGAAERPPADETTVRTDAQGGLDIARAGAAVAARREELGYSQRRLHDDGVIAHGELEAFERGRSWPAESIREKVEDALRWPPGTIARVARGAEVPEDDDTETLSDSVQLEVMLDYAEITLDGLAARIAALPPVSDPDFGAQAAEQLGAAAPAAGHHRQRRTQRPGHRDHAGPQRRAPHLQRPDAARRRRPGRHAGPAPVRRTAQSSTQRAGNRRNHRCRR